MSIQRGEKAGGASGTMEKLIVANGSVAMDLDLSRLSGGARLSKASRLRFDVEPDSFFTVVVLNDELRGPVPSSMRIIPLDSARLPGTLGASYDRLVVESLAWSGQYDLAIRNAETGFIYFNIEGYLYDYNASNKSLSLQIGRLLLSPEFAQELGRPSDAGALVGQISINANMRPIEVTHYTDGEADSAVLPADPQAGTVPGPDVVVGDLSGLAQFGSSSGTQVGLAVGTDSCNFGTVDLNWNANPANDHPVIPQNLYRQSGGTTNDERFEQIGQSSVKHAFTALTQNLCNLGCNGVGGSRLGSGCSDPYSASLNSGPNLGSRAWINPYTGAYPRNDSPTPNNSHLNHTHSGPSHRILTEIADLNTTLNPGATYFAEGQYVTPHEYVWCQANPTQCNQNNNVSYRQYSVTGTGSPFSFSPVNSTQRQKVALTAWNGASVTRFEPDPGNDGIGFVGYKVTNPSPGVWHYEYAIYNQNIERAIQSFSVPVGAGVTLSNVGFHAPPQHPGWAADGTLNNAGFSNAAWTGSQVGGVITWSSETFAQNQNANAIRWGTLYNFRFDSNRPPQTMNATLGFLKTGNPLTVSVQGPAPVAISSATVSGRVSRSDGQGIGGVYVFMVDSQNVMRQTISSSFGYYSFQNVPTGLSYTFGATSKRYHFPDPTVVSVNDNIANLNFVEVP
ncbi:MAG TPA: carboxypeptidase-like regulatory domain-containing protein [Pyrinomonadaceae bacterium]|nr:carboxypeptidase-like regulatory domain-containing protein [Pyrinomonadaceae bacterium]